MRILILSDIHGNIDALNCVLNHAKNKYDILISLGDIVGYGPCPCECIDIIAEKAEISLAGNHELVVCNKISSHDFSARAKHSAKWTQNQLDADRMMYLASLESAARYNDISLSHGSPDNPVWGYIFSGLDAIIAFAGADFSLAFFGHTHVPSYFAAVSAEGTKTQLEIAFGKTNLSLKTKNSGRRMMINPGSVGFPRSIQERNDKNSRFDYAQYALFDPESGNWQFKQVRYDKTNTRKLMDQAGLWPY